MLYKHVQNTYFLFVSLFSIKITRFFSNGSCREKMKKEKCVNCFLSACEKHAACGLRR